MLVTMATPISSHVKDKDSICNDIDVIVLFTSGPHLRHNYHGNKTLETMLSGSVEFVGHRLNRPVLLHLCVCRVLPINNATVSSLRAMKI